MTTPDERHLRSDGLREYLAAGKPARVTIAGDPPVWLVIDPMDERLALRTEWVSGDLPSLDAYRHLSFVTGFADGVHYAEFTVRGNAVLLEAYPALCAVADRVQFDGASLNAAVTEVLAGYHELLRGLGRLSDEEEVGLFGELLVLGGLTADLGTSTALASWQGPFGEEHDFSLQSDDIEVKSTTSEVRRHWIGSSTQLLPTPARPLWLLSIQLTAAGLGGKNLAEMVGAARDSCTGDALIRLDEAFLRAGWSDIHAPLYRRRFRLRTEPLFFAVDSSFPAITLEHLKRAEVPVERIAAIRYLLDLTGLVSSPGPAELSIPEGLTP